MNIAHLNHIPIEHPRWHDRTVLPRVDKVKPGWNVITVNHKNYPNKYLIHSMEVRKYPIETKKSKQGNEFDVYVIPMAHLKTKQELDQEIITAANELFN